MISLSMLVVGILVGLMLCPMVEAIEDGTFFDWGDEDEHHERRWDCGRTKKIGAETPIKKETEYQNKVFSDIKDLENNIESIQLYIHINILFTVSHLEQEQYEFLKKLESIYGRYDDG